MATIKKPKIQALSADDQAFIARIKAAKAARQPLAPVAFKRMSPKAQSASLRAHS